MKEYKNRYIMTIAHCFECESCQEITHLAGRAPRYCPYCGEKVKEITVDNAPKEPLKYAIPKTLGSLLS